MPFSRFTKMPDEKRERLLVSAAQEFAVNGFEGASLNHILGIAQIGKSTAYYYFEDKADLFCTTISYCLDRLQFAPDPALLDTLTPTSFWDEMGKIHNRPLQQAQQNPWVFGAIRAAEHLPPEALQQPSLASLTAALTDYMMSHIGAALQRGQALGVIRTDLPIALLIGIFRAIDVACDDWLLAHVAEMDQIAITTFSQQTIAIIRQALAPPSLMASSF
jgi:AcrR family transcriptional regulator